MSSKNIWRYFEIPPGCSGNMKAKCTICKSFVSGSTSVSSNFVTHLKRKHPSAHAEYLASAVTPVANQHSLTTFMTSASKYDQKNPKQVKLTDALIMFVAGDLLPLSVVESPGFRQLMAIADPQYQVPSRKHLSTTLLTKKFQAIDQKLRQELARAQCVCLTLDIWSSRQMRGYLGVTVHYLNDWTLRQGMLACKRFKGSHTGDHIFQVYQELVECYEISSKVAYVVTDNASNMKKAFALPGYEMSEETTNEDDEEFGYIQSSDNLVSFNEHLPNHSSCFNHTLQLCVSDGLKEAGPLARTIAKASKIVAHVRKSTLSSDILEGEKRLQTACPTRWNSQLYMLRSILSISDLKLKEASPNVQLSKYERNILEDLVSILTPFEQATKMTQQDTTVSSSFVVPCIRGLKSKLMKMDARYHCNMVTSLRNSVNRRLSTYEENNIFITACILDPRFKLQWCSADEKVHFKQLLLDSISKDQQEQQEHIESPPKKKAKIDNCDTLFDFMDDTPTCRPTSYSTEVEEYLNEPTEPRSSDPLNFWRKHHDTYPKLSSLAAQYLNIPATSAPVERMFSIAGKNFRPDRCLMTDTTFESLMFLKCNGHLCNAL